MCLSLFYRNQVGDMHTTGLYIISYHISKPCITMSHPSLQPKYAKSMVLGGGG